MSVNESHLSRWKDILGREYECANALSWEHTQSTGGKFTKLVMLERND